MSSALLADLHARGLIFQIAGEDGLPDWLDAGSRTLYCGFDPTADSLHIGSLVPLLMLRRFQLAGHRPLALVGGAALLLGAGFFLSLAFSRGWIGPSMQVALGLAGGSIGLLIGAFLLFRGERVVGQVLTAVGLAVIILSLFAATSLYELIEPTLALAGVFSAAALTTFIAIRGRSQVVAGFGLVAVLAAPPIMGAEPELITVAYMAVTLVAIAVVSMWQSWWWLSPIRSSYRVGDPAGWMRRTSPFFTSMPRAS